MKTMKYLSLLFIMMAMTVCVTSCSDDDEPEVLTASIIGEWHRETKEIKETYKFNANGTGYQQIIEFDEYGQETDNLKTNFEYSLRDTDTGTHYVRIVEKAQTYEMKYDVTISKLLIYTNSGSYYEYKRK